MHFTYFVILNASLFAKVELPKIATDYLGIVQTLNFCRVECNHDLDV